MPEEKFTNFQYKIEKLKGNLSTVIRGKADAIDILTVALLAEGSVLVEDVPGVGKTTMIKALSQSVDAEHSRIQFTPDLLPADILGSSIYNPTDGSFRFRKGPIFCNILLADEINRASPRTQSALLEAMSEKQATIEGCKYSLPEPFMVIATENPVEYHGTYPLPEAQLDRFLMKINIGYPDNDTEVDILYSQATSHPLDDLDAVLTCADVVAMQKEVRNVSVEKSVSNYIVSIVDRTRNDSSLKLGISPRGSLMLFRACQALAILRQRKYVLPDDVQYLAPFVLSHRIILTSKARYSGLEKHTVIESILQKVKVPT